MDGLHRLDWNLVPALNALLQDATSVAPLVALGSVSQQPAVPSHVSDDTSTTNF